MAETKQPTAPSPEDILLGDTVPFGGVNTSGRGSKLKGEGMQTWERKALSAAEERALNRKTRPWTAEEYIYLNGVPHVYVPNRDIGTIVFLRGGGSMLLRDAFVRNVSISGPFKLRLDDLYSVPAGIGGNVKWTPAS